MKKHFSLSLTTEMIIVSVAGLVLAALLYIILSVTIDSALDRFFDTEEYYRHCDEKLIDSLSSYAEENNVSSDDWYQLNKWVDKEDVITLTVYKDGEVAYDSQSSYDSYDSDDSYIINSAVTIDSSYVSDASYTVEFKDGSADVYIYGIYSTNYYQIAYIVEFMIPCVFFILVIMTAVHRKMRYIIQLSKEIYLIESGDLEHPLTIRGKDELSALARSVDSLRQSFLQKLARIMQLQEESKALVTEMSHDLRTPMTPLMIYLGMLCEKRYESDEERDSYIEKSYEKASQLKHMSDNMFAYFIMDKNADTELEVLSMHTVFYDLLSSIKGYLTVEGYQVETTTNMTDAYITVNTEFMLRIFDNLVSNILKYADRESAVILNLFSENGKVIVHVSNRINELADHSASTGFGVKNIKKMMQQMSAECIIHQKDDRYDTFLLFRITEDDPASAEE